MFTDQQLKVIQYCATECEHQGSGEVSVYDMLNAWNWAQERRHQVRPVGVPESHGQIYPLQHIPPEQKISLDFIEHLGRLVEPQDNKNGFRTIPIFISTGYYGEARPIGSHSDNIERDLSLLIESYYEGNFGYDTPVGEYGGIAYTPEDYFYYQYESIHPFRDGNGRTGKILYNYLCGTLENPIWPPNFFGGSNP